jgi:hypothetical protein
LLQAIGVGDVSALVFARLEHDARCARQPLVGRLACLHTLDVVVVRRQPALAAHQQRRPMRRKRDVVPRDQRLLRTCGRLIPLRKVRHTIQGERMRIRKIADAECRGVAANRIVIIPVEAARTESNLVIVKRLAVFVEMVDT